MSALFNYLVSNSVILFFVIFILSVSSALAGKYLFKKCHAKKELVDDGTKIVLGAVLSLLGLLIGFLLTISIGGYNNRAQMEENESIAIGNAFQRAQLLSPENSKKANILLNTYINARIEFFNAGSQAKNEKWRDISLTAQSILWQLAATESRVAPNPVIVSVLTAFSDLYVSEEKTMASWRYQIPGAAWVLLILFSVSANVLIGFNNRGLRGNNMIIFILPLLTTMALFMIAEIDIPGEGIIHVIPDNLINLRTDLFTEQ
ncbi:hypothetical protein AB9E65_13710 [Escherichia coli]|uniref:bestrophin-like domain n=1 Tax=Escherichia coli TaxID=562 RepID=UPI0038B6A2DB